MRLNPYLLFNGNCEAAFKFYEQLLHGKIEAIMTYAGAPAERGVPAEWRDKIMHARLVMGEAVLMGSDAPPERFEKAGGFFVSLNVDDPADGARIFDGLSTDGEVRMPFQQTFWAFRFGMLVDRFGIPWMIDCEKSA